MSSTITQYKLAILTNEIPNLKLAIGVVSSHNPLDWKKKMAAVRFTPIPCEPYTIHKSAREAISLQ